MTLSIQQQYSELGYCVIRDAIPSNSIEDCLRSLELIKRRKTFLYYSQSTHRWIRPRCSERGYLYDSILNPSQQIQAPALASSVRKIIYHDIVFRALSALFPSHRDFVSWQDMLFDRSTGTVDHLDSWYLDTESQGHLVGIWFALEDIYEQSGPFFVSPGSHKLGPINKQDVAGHDEFLASIQRRIRQHDLKKHSLLVRKGDIVIWNSLAIHGAFGCQDEEYSRKSITSHYYPVGCRRNDAASWNDLIRDFKSLRATNHLRIHRLSKPGRTPLFYAVGGPLLAIRQQLGYISRNSWNMRRSK